MQIRLYRVFIVAFLCVLGLILSMFFPAMLDKDAILTFLVLSAILLPALFLLTRVKISDRVYSLFTAALIAVMFIIQLSDIEKGLYMQKSGDHEAVLTGVKELVLYGRFTESTLYYQMYPHQLFTTLFYAAANRLFTYAGMEGPVSHTATYVLNALLTNTGALLFYFGVKRLSCGRTAFVSTLLFSLYLGYYGAVKRVYTHQLSVVFACLVVFVMSRFVSEQRPKHRVAVSASLGGAIALAMSVSGVLALAIPAALIYILISSKGLKQTLAEITGVLFGFLLIIAAANGVYKALDIIDSTDAENMRIPYTHWIAVGLSEDGMYSEEDFQAMVTAKTKEAKNEYALTAIKERLKSRGFSESVRFFYNKEKLVWVGSSYGGFGAFALDRTAYNAAYRFLLITMLFISTLRLALFGSKDKRDCFSFAYIWIFGIFLFFIMWEVYPVYLFSSFPILLFASTRFLFDIDGYSGRKTKPGHKAARERASG